MAVMLMTSSKTSAPELKMIARDSIEMIKHHSNSEQTLQPRNILKVRNQDDCSWRNQKGLRI